MSMNPYHTGIRRKSSLVPISDAETIVILTPHNEAIRQEYALAFKKWYKKKTGKEVNVDWRYQGGGRDATRYLESMYNNNFKLYWERELGRSWTSEVASAFNSRSENFLFFAISLPKYHHIVTLNTGIYAFVFRISRICWVQF